MKKQKRSEYIEAFLNFLTLCEQEYDSASREKERTEKQQQDYLHQLELDKQTYSERAKLATKLRNCRLERRQYKDILEETEPIVQFFEEPQHKKTREQLKQLLGQMRKVENYHQNRQYRKRFQEKE